MCEGITDGGGTGGDAKNEGGEEAYGGLAPGIMDDGGGYMWGNSTGESGGEERGGIAKGGGTEEVGGEACGGTRIGTGDDS